MQKTPLLQPSYDRIWKIQMRYLGIQPQVGNFWLARLMKSPCQTQIPVPKGLWNSIWKLHLPQRIRMFTWLIYHGKILTNLEKYHRGYAADSSCHFCPSEIEDLNHLFIFCAKTDLFWQRLLGGRYCKN